MAVELTRGMLRMVRAALVSAMLPGRSTGRVASSMTMISKPRCLPSRAEKPTQKS